MMRGLFVCHAAVAIGCALSVGTVHAQSVRDSVAVTSPAVTSPAVTQAVAEARVRLERGEGEEARALLDSLVQTTAAGSLDLAEVLYWRATLAERAADAERDWRRVVVEVPLSPRTPDVLLRLGDLEMLRQRPSQARRYFERVVREFPGTPQRVRAVLWLARSHVEARDVPTGCRTFATLGGGDIPEGELQLQANELRRQCAAVLLDSATSAPSTAPSKDTASGSAREKSVGGAKDAGRYSVQVGAFETEQEARQMVARMAKREFEARIDGVTKPFRVRIGRYAVRSDAVAVQRRVKAMGIDAFVAELPR